MATAPKAPKAPTPRDPNAPAKSYGKNLSDGSGATLRFIAVRRKDGSASAYALHIERDKDGKVTGRTRGATTNHADFEAAKKQVNADVQAAMKAGWKARRGGGGFRSVADSFDISSLPKAK